MLLKIDLLNKLKDSNINYKIHNHQVLFTINDSTENRGNIKGGTHKKLIFKKPFYIQVYQKLDYSG